MSHIGKFPKIMGIALSDCHDDFVRLSFCIVIE